MKTIGQNYLISKAIITADRILENDANEINVTHIIAELTIKEIAGKPYTTGQVAMVDQSGILRAIKLVGSERLIITFEPAFDNGLLPIVRTYIMRGTNVVVNNNTYVFDLIEEFGYEATSKVIAEAYTDHLENIIQRVVVGKLKKKLNAIYPEDITDRPTNDKAHVVVPNMTPWETLQWLSNRLTSKTGTPWFLCGSLYNDEVNLWSMEKALESDPFNLDYPFIKSETMANFASGSENEGRLEAETLILEHYEGQTDSLHALDRANSIAGNYDYVDTNSNSAAPLFFEIINTINKLENKELIKGQDILDVFFKINDQQMMKKPSCSMTEFSSSGTYLKGSSYSEKPNDADKQNVLSNRMIKNVMDMKGIRVKTSGTLFALKRASVGRKVRLLFDTPDVASDKKTPGFDGKLSGDYIITGITHQFSNTEYVTTIDAVKFHRDMKEYSVVG